MAHNECLNFQQLFDFIRNKHSRIDLTLFQEHILKCKKCTDELILIKNMWNAMTKNKKSVSSVQCDSKDHFSDELKEQYLQNNLTDNESKMVGNHFKKCPFCKEKIELINSTAQIKITPEEKAKLQEIESVNIEDRLSSYKEYFILPEKKKARSLKNQIIMILQNAVQRYISIPKLGFAMVALLLLMIPTYFGYQYFNIAKIIKQVESEFSDFKNEHRITDGNLRPTGRFLFTLFGKPRSNETQPQVNDTYASIAKALKYEPENATLNHYLGTLYFFDGNMDKAEEYYLKSLQLNGNRANIFNDLSLIDCLRKDFQKAIEHLRQALDLEPSLNEAQYNLAVIYELLGNKEEAIAAWEKYIKLDVDENSDWNKVARSHLKALTP